MMKKMIVSLAMVLSSAVIAQTPVPIVKAEDGSLWVGHAQTFKVYKDGFSMMVSKIYAPSEKKDNLRFFIGATRADCAQGYGVLMSRKNESEKWVRLTNFVVEGTSTVGDELAAALCGTGKLLLENNKSIDKNST